MERFLLSRILKGFQDLIMEGKDVDFLGGFFRVDPRW